MKTPTGKNCLIQIESRHVWIRDSAHVVLIVLFCGVLGYLRWVKMETLNWGDTPRWLFEAQRVAAGQVPYRDFSWNYPPFSVFSLGWTMRWFGVTFIVAQIFVDTISIVVVLTAYSLARLVLPRFLLLPVMFCFVAVCGTSLMFFNLFSLLTYVPALQTAVGGLLLFLLGVLNYVQTGKMKPTNWLMVTAGAFVASYSKPETLLATFSILALLAIVDRYYWFDGRNLKDWFWHCTRLGLAGGGPVLMAYLWTGFVAGFANMKAGITGYGLAGDICPWWPTGLGIFGATSSLGEAVFLVAALSFTRRKYFAARLGRAYYYALGGGLAGLCIYLAYVFYNNWELLTGSHPIVDKIWYSGPNTFWTSAVLLPVMWSCVILWLYLIIRFFFLRKQRPTVDHFTILILLTGPVVMSARGWFNWNLETRTAVPGVCYPFFLVLGPYLLWRALAWGESTTDLPPGTLTGAAIAVVALLLSYGSLRLIAAYPHLLSNRMYQPLSTLAGNVRLIDYKTDSEIYRFVLENTSPTDTILDLPYGGGINFAAHRLSPFFETQFQQLSMPERFLEKDLEAVRQHPPKIVIADNEPNYGASYGLKANSCVFPHLVWAPSAIAVDDRIFPAILYIQQNYRIAKVVGRKQLLVPK